MNKQWTLTGLFGLGRESNGKLQPKIEVRSRHQTVVMVESRGQSEAAPVEAGYSLYHSID
jgi:hypothetical protein